MTRNLISAALVVVFTAGMMGCEKHEYFGETLDGSKTQAEGDKTKGTTTAGASTSGEETVDTSSGGAATGGATSGEATSGGASAGGGSSGGSTSGGASSGGTPTAGCGNGEIETGEDCDDGAKTPGDGCSDVCKVESGWTCASGAPSTCTKNPDAPKTYCNKIAYVSNVDGTAAQNVLLDSDCTGRPPALKLTNYKKDPGLMFFQSSPAFKPDGSQVAADNFGIINLLLFFIPMGGTTSFFDINANPPTNIASVDMDMNGDGKAEYIPRGFEWNPDGSKFAFVALQMPQCGNGIPEGMEQCDDMNHNDDDGCNNNCQKPGETAPPPSDQDQFFLKAIRLGTDSADINLVNSKMIVANNAKQNIDIGKIAWADNSTVVFAAKEGRRADLGQWDLYGVDVNTGTASLIKIEGVETTSSDEMAPAFSKEGKRMLFVREGDIWSCDFKTVSGSYQYSTPDIDLGIFGHIAGTTTTFNYKYYTCDHVSNLTVTSGKTDKDVEIADSTPCFSHDQKFIFFTSNRAVAGKYNRDVYRINADGSNLYNVTRTDYDEHDVACSPIKGPEGVPASDFIMHKALIHKAVIKKLSP